MFIAEYVSPKFQKQAFNCAHCKAFSQQYWAILKVSNNRRNPNNDEKHPLGLQYKNLRDQHVHGRVTYNLSSLMVGDIISELESSKALAISLNSNSSFCSEIINLYASECNNCLEFSIWNNEKLVFPSLKAEHFPNKYMPDEIKKDFNEAAEVLSISSRAACALLRLALQKTLKVIGGEGKDINTDIKNLLKDGTLSRRLQKACDSIRIIGNESVHPGTLNIEDNIELANSLFIFINLIIKDTLETDALVNNTYDSLPEGKLKGIETRDN